MQPRPVDLSLIHIYGTFSGGHVEQGMAEDAIYLDFEGSEYQIPEEVMTVYNQAVEDLKSGALTVPATVDEALTWTAG